MIKIKKGKYYKTKEIFEQVVNKPIYLIFDTTPDSNFVTTYRNTHKIVMSMNKSYLANFANEQEYYRSFEHELSHIVFGSDVDAVKVITDVTKVHSEIVRIILNMIEDYRVDYLWNRLYPGSGKVRQNMLQRLARNMIKSDNLVDILNAVRCDPNTIHEISVPEIKILAQHFLRILKKVENKSFKATVAATIETLKLIEKYIDKDDGTEETVQDEDQDEGQGRQVSEDEEQEEQGIKAEDIDGNKLDQVLFKFTGAKTESDMCTQFGYNYKNMLERTTEELYEEAREEAEKQIIELEQKIKQMIEPDINRMESKKVYGNIIEYVDKTVEATIEPDYKLAARLSKLFKQIRARIMLDNDSEGTEIDIDQIIRHKIDKNVTDVFETEDTTEGFNIAILIDCSGSMVGNPLRIAKMAAATLARALKSINCNTIFVAFTAVSNNGYNIEEVNEDELLRLIGGGFTPTWAAVRYAANKLQKFNGRKMILIITDGLPEDGVKPSSMAAGWTAANIRDVRKSGIEVFTLFITNSISVDKRFMSKVFGPEYTWETVDNIDELPKKMIRLVSEKIVKKIGR